MAEMNATGFQILDEDDMASDSATAVATQQSIKAYNDTLSTIGTYDLISAVTISGSPATVEFLGLTSTYDAYELYLISVVPATLDSSIALQVSADNGSTWETNGLDYSQGTFNANGTVDDPSRNEIRFNGLGTIGAGTLGISSYVYIAALTSSSTKTQITSQGANYDDGTSGFTMVLSDGKGRNAATENDAFRILPTTAASIASGQMFLYGIKQ